MKEKLGKLPLVLLSQRIQSKQKQISSKDKSLYAKNTVCIHKDYIYCVAYYVLKWTGWLYICSIATQFLIAWDPNYCRSVFWTNSQDIFLLEGSSSITVLTADTTGVGIFTRDPYRIYSITSVLFFLFFNCPALSSIQLSRWLWDIKMIELWSWKESQGPSISILFSVLENQLYKHWEMANSLFLKV